MLLQTHEPLDLVVIMLGTNDTKIMFGHTPMTMRLAMERMIRLVQNTDAWSDTGVRPQILLVAPPRCTEKNALTHCISGAILQVG